MLKKYRGLLIFLLVVAAAIALIALLGGGSQSFEKKYEGADLTADVSGLGREDTYDGYLLAHADAKPADSAVEVDIAAFEGEGELRRDESGADCVYTPDGAETTWTVDVPQAGLYNLRLDYKTVESRGVDMERALYINGELPFDGAATLSFPRLWTDAGEVRKDNQGNDVRPTQVERFRQRFMHKLVYFPSNNEGMYSCVGCGRCLAKCPQNLNIVKVIKALGGDEA